MSNTNTKTDLTVCLGSSCHLKGSQEIIARLRELIIENKAEDKIAFKGAFCFGRCEEGVNVKVGEDFFTVHPDTVDEFFDKEIKPKL